MKPAAVVLASVLLAPAWLAAQTTVDQKRPAAPDGAVSIENMAGSVKVTGWDKAEVQVRGTVGEGGELSFEGSGKRTHIEIEADHNPMGIKSDLEVFVPAGSSVDIEGFQATISVTGVDGLRDGRDGQRVDRAGGSREARRAAERQRRDRASRTRRAASRPRPSTAASWCATARGTSRPRR